MQDVKLVPFNEKWTPFCNISDNLVLMVRHSIEGVFNAPLYIHRFQLLLPHHQVEAEKFICIDPDKLINTSDKLRYYRHKKALLQR